MEEDLHGEQPCFAMRCLSLRAWTETDDADLGSVDGKRVAALVNRCVRGLANADVCCARAPFDNIFVSGFCSFATHSNHLLVCLAWTNEETD